MIGQLRSTRKEECYSPAVSQYNAAVSSEAMAFCHVSQGALMKIECMHEPPSKLHGVIISATKVKVNIISFTCISFYKKLLIRHSAVRSLKYQEAPVIGKYGLRKYR